MSTGIDIVQSPLFAKKKKRLSINEMQALDNAIRRIIEARFSPGSAYNHGATVF